MAVGRISGPLLKANLIRDGIDLAFETDLLYLNVTDSRIGIRTSTPNYDLHVNGTTKSTDLEVINEFTIGNFSISGNNIVSDLPTINFIAGGGEATIYHSRLIVNDIEFNNNTISTNVSNSNLELRPNGTGIVDIQSSTQISGTLDVYGEIFATGNITIDGNLIIGDSLTDTVTINASIQSDLIPETTGIYDLGSNTFRWRDIYSVNINADDLNLNTLEIGDLDFFDTTITTTTNTDLNLFANGTGSVIIENFAFSGNTITNISNNAITEITQTGTGYFKIAGTNAFVPPVGNSSDRPTAYAVEGMMRYNTDNKALEIWDGLTWSSPAGTTGAVSEGTANDIAIQIALTLG